MQAAPEGDGATLVSVETFRLLKRYRPALFPAALRELDRAQRDVARRLHGRIDRRRVVRAAGRRAAQYDLSYRRGGADLRQRATYVLAGRREHLLVCRWDAARADALGDACVRLLASFRLR